MYWRQRFILILSIIEIMSPLSSATHATEVPPSLSQSREEIIITEEQQKILEANKEHDAIPFPLPESPSLEERKKIQELHKPLQDRYQRLRRAVEYFSQSILITAEYFTQHDLNSSSFQTQLWDNLTTQLYNRSFSKYIIEVHYVNLDNPKVQNIDEVQDKANYNFKFQGNNRVISVVIFKPKSIGKKSPIVIFNHGGQPSDYIKPSSENPQFIAYAELGFVIACPNYRGGSAQNHEEDMEAVTQYLSQFDDIDTGKTVLAGISAGTTLNAQILDKPIARKFAGIFLHTGLYKTFGILDVLSRISLDDLGYRQVRPILIVSGAKDSLVDLESTLHYIKKLQNMSQDFRYLILNHGGHQLVSLINSSIPAPRLEDKPIYTQDEISKITKAIHKRYNTREVMLYASHLVEFLDRIAYGELSPIPPLSDKGKITKPLGRHIIAKAQTLQSLKSMKAPVTNPSLMDLNEGLKQAPFTLSESHLKVILGDEFDPHDLDKTILAFLKKYDSEKIKIQEEFGKLYDVKSSEWDPVMGETSADNKELRALIRQIIETERLYKGAYVLYHGANSKVGFIYDVYSTLRRLFLLEMPGQENKHVKILRAIDDAFLKFLSLEDFITHMRPLEPQYPSLLFNYLPGYEDVGLSCQWFLFGSYKYWASSTFFRYFRQNFSNKDISIQTTLEKFFTAIGIKDEKILKEIGNRYQHLYERYIDQNDGRLFQIFISPSVIDDLVYVSEIGGYPFDIPMGASSNITHAPSKILEKSFFEPIKFEEILKNNRPYFKQQFREDREEFQKNELTLKYINSLEARLFMKPQFMEDPRKIQIIDYHAHEFQKGYHGALQKQVSQDLSLWIDRTPPLSLAMTHKTPPLVKLQDYVKHGLKKSPSKRHDPRQEDELVRLLLDKKWGKAKEFIRYNPESLNLIIDDRRHTLLYYFLSKNNLEAAQWLIKHNISLSTEDVFDLIDENKIAALDILFENNPHLTTQITQENNLILMIKSKRSNVCLWLIKNGAPIEENYNGWDTKLILASLYGLTDVVNALIAKMAERNPDNLQYYLNYKNDSNFNALELAVDRRHRDTALALIEAGAQIDVTTKQGSTPLIIAAREGLTDVVNALIAKMAKSNPEMLHQYLDRKNVHNLNALELAVDRGQRDTALALIEAGAQIDVIDNEGMPPLIVAAREGLTDVVNALIAKMAKNNPDKLHQYLNRKNVHNINALELAVDRGRGDTALALIEAGAQIDVINTEGSTPLIVASIGGLTDVVNALIAKMAKSNPEMLHQYLDQKNIYNFNALNFAVDRGHRDIALALIKAGAQIDVTTKQGSTPLIVAASGGLTDVVNALIAKMAKSNPDNLHQYLDRKNVHNFNALELAIDRGREDAALILIKAGAQIDVIDNKGSTPLIVASIVGLTDVVNALIAKMAKSNPDNLHQYLDRKNVHNFNALQLAVDRGHRDTALALIKAGAQIDVTDDEGCTPLIVAANGGLTDVVNALIAKMAENNPEKIHQYIDQKDVYNINALLLALDHGHADTALALIKSGARIDVTTEQGSTPLIIAAREGLTDVVNTLITKMAKSNPERVHQYLNQKNVHNFNALELAIDRGREDAALILIKAGAQIDVIDNKGSTPLIVAATTGLVNVVEAVISKMQEVRTKHLQNYLDHTNSNKDNALILAIFKGHEKIALLLIEASAHIDIANFDGNTPLMFAAANNLIDVVQILIHKMKTNNPHNLIDYITRKNTNHLSALDFARNKGNVEIVKILTEAIQQKG